MHGRSINTVLIATLDERDYDSRVIPKVLPTSLDTSVTYLSGSQDDLNGSYPYRDIRLPISSDEMRG
jgi:hypothetical protein